MSLVEVPKAEVGRIYRNYSAPHLAHMPDTFIRYSPWIGMYI